MPRRETDRKIGGGYCRIRKRGCSSSSSSSLARRYQFKRAILIGKRYMSGRLPPPWRLGSTPPSAANVAESTKHAKRRGGGGSEEEEALPRKLAAAVSARKLAATLWGMKEVPSPRVKKKDVEREQKGSAEEKIAKSSLPTRLSDLSHSPVSEKMDRPRTVTYTKRTSPPLSQKLQKYAIYSHFGDLDFQCNAGVIKIETQCQGWTPPAGSIVGVKSRLKDVSNSITASKELVKVLNRIWGVEERYSSSIHLVSALRVELDRAHIQVDRSIQEHQCSQNEIDYLMKQLVQEKAAWKTKEQKRFCDAISTLAGELEVEKKLRRQTERLNKKLGKELAETKVALSNAVKELECERRAREALEGVYAELARGIGEDRARAEELKRESARVREEVEEEREMLQLADVLREERVQMKLLEANYQFEEKNAAVDKLRNELEAYLGTNLGKEQGNGSPNFSTSKEFQNYVGKMCSAHSCENKIEMVEDNEGEVAGKEEEHEGDDSADDSDLHSIELNVDSNNRSYKWSYACGGDDAQYDLKSVSVDNVLDGIRKSSSEKIQWGKVYLGRQSSDRGEWEFGAESPENSVGFDGERSSNLPSQAQRNDCAEEIERYKSVNGLRDQIMSSSRMAFSQGFAGPRRQWGQSMPSQDPGSTAALEDSVASLQWSVLSARLSEIKGECR